MMTTVRGERHIMAVMVKGKEHAYNAYQNKMAILLLTCFIYPILFLAIQKTSLGIWEPASNPNWVNVSMVNMVNMLNPRTVARGIEPATLDPCSAVPAPEHPVFTCGLQVVALVGVFVQEEVVACALLGDPPGQLLHLGGLRAGQLDQLLLKVDMLWTKDSSHQALGTRVTAIVWPLTKLFT